MANKSEVLEGSPLFAYCYIEEEHRVPLSCLLDCRSMEQSSLRSVCINVRIHTRLSQNDC